jgi:hypothetical protein
MRTLLSWILSAAILSMTLAGLAAIVRAGDQDAAPTPPPQRGGAKTKTGASDQNAPATPAPETPKGRKEGGTGKPQAKPSAPPASGQIEFADLAAPADQSKPALPYGQPFTIHGTTSQVCIGGQPVKAADGAVTCKTGRPLSDLISATDVQVDYGIAKDAEKVNGGDWSVKITKLEPDTPVTFKFSFTGKVSPAGAATLLDRVLGSEKFNGALNQFISAAQGKTAAQQAPLAAGFAQLVAQQVLDALSALSLTPANTEEFRKALSTTSIEDFGPYVNLPDEAENVFRKVGAEGEKKLGISRTMTFSQLNDALSAVVKMLPPGDDFLPVINAYLANYRAILARFQVDVAANLAVSIGATASDITADLKKYAGFDVGALYAPRLHELRSFATVNIYWGPVSLHPDKGTRSPLLERLSLTFGMALKDVSGRDSDKTKIKDQNVFIYGMGFRLNKYFRLTAGGMVYRMKAAIPGPIDNKLRHEFFLGPSIDITALPALEGIFGKKQSN